jgi:mannose-1-phosphate guanylyltransferase
MTLYATILAGGSGTRFWPKSRANLPKQFLVLQGTQSLLQNTVKRIEPLIPAERTLVVTAAHQRPETVRQLPHVPSANILAEPLARNTSAAVALAAWHLLTLDPNAMMIVLPADHAIADRDAFCACLQQAAIAAQHHEILMTLGVRPTYAATGYGYIKTGASLSTPNAPDARKAVQFTEKPNADAASRMIKSGDYLWNCGIFIWQAATITRELQRYLPDLWNGVQAYGAAWQAGADSETLYQHYAQLPSLSVDYGVLEKSDHVGVIPASFDWSDVGSWRALTDLHATDGDGNIIVGNHVGQDSANLIVYSPDKLIATVGVSNLIIVQTDDVLLICDKERDQDVKNFIEILKQQGQTDYL